MQCFFLIRKLELLVPLLKKGAVSGPDAGLPERTIVFVQKKHVASDIKKKLVQQWGMKAEDIHGDRSQSQREAALAKFRAGEIDVLMDFRKLQSPNNVENMEI